MSKYRIFSGSYSVRMQENMDHEKLYWDTSRSESK